MQEGGKAVVWFNEVNRDNIALVGGKGANLGEMITAGIPVPPGFIVTSTAYFDFLEKEKLLGEIREMLDHVDINDSRMLREASNGVKQLIENAPIPSETVRAITHAYREMGQGLVAVRSSATAEDLPEASFAGQQSTFLNIQGINEVVDAVRKCWASLFEARAIFYRVQQKYDHFKVGIAVPVQRMVQSEKSGVMFTLDPMTNNRDHIAIEAIYGLGEMIVSGDVTPDNYLVSKDGLSILKREIAAQEWKLIRNGVSNVKVPLTPEEQARQKISDMELTSLAELGKRLEHWYKCPQDIEWAIENDSIFVLQTRPVTTAKNGAPAQTHEIKAPVLLTGAPASPGIASGRVSLILDVDRIDDVKQGDVLVAEMTTPDFVPAMKRAVAIVTDRGGRTAHAAIVSRELGIPCIVGTGKATTILKAGQTITVDGSGGKVYNGKVEIQKKGQSGTAAKLKTRTKLLVNLAQPELAEKVAAMNVDGVGLLRAEFMAAQIGEHPSYLLSHDRGNEFITKMAEGMSIFAKSFYPRQVVYRATDFKTNEYRALKGGEQIEGIEENPMIGYRGASRYIRDVAVFRLELEAVKKVRERYNNLWVMIPFVRTVNELAQTLKIMEAAGLKRSPDFKIWMMVEVPSNVILLEKFLSLGVDGVSIGSNDLTQLTLGIDRDNAKLADTFDERDEAVMCSLERIVKVTKSMGITCSICGQAPSFYPELTEKLVEWGITSVSVSPDVIDTTRAIIARAEERLGAHK